MNTPESANPALITYAETISAAVAAAVLRTVWELHLQGASESSPVQTAEIHAAVSDAVESVAPVKPAKTRSKSKAAAQAPAPAPVAEQGQMSFDDDPDAFGPESTLEDGAGAGADDGLGNENLDADFGETDFSAFVDDSTPPLPSAGFETGENEIGPGSYTVPAGTAGFFLDSSSGDWKTGKARKVPAGGLDLEYYAEYNANAILNAKGVALEDYVVVVNEKEPQVPEGTVIDPAFWVVPKASLQVGEV